MPDNKDKRHEHIKRRREQDKLTYRELENDFHISKSKIHRDLTKEKDSEPS